MAETEAGTLTPDGAGGRGVPLYLQILAAMIAGIFVGQLLGSRASALGQFGTILIQMIRVMAAPLLFFAIVDAFIRSEMEGRRGLWLAGICLINTTAALVVGLTVSNVLRPGEHMALPSLPAATAPAAPVQRIDFVKALTGYVPSNIVQPFLENSVLSIVLLALLV
ncbi:MAG: cation:dicarboxylase symporter family transporter, partial [Vicinamibacterales bacterium]